MSSLDPRHGSRCVLHEVRGGWHYNGLQGICIALSARDEFMLLKVEHDPSGYWPVDSRVIVELGTDRHGRTTAYFEETFPSKQSTIAETTLSQEFIGTLSSD